MKATSSCMKYIVFFAGLKLSYEWNRNQTKATVYMHILNAMQCNSMRPDVDVRLNTSLDSSIEFFSNGSNKIMGNLSVHPLFCNDSHTQVLRVSVHSTENFTVMGEIVNALLSPICINVSGEYSIYSELLCTRRFSAEYFGVL